MEKADLIRQLLRATQLAVESARDFCRQDLRGPAQYRVLSNQSHDGNRQPDEVVFDDEDSNQDALGPWSAEEVASWMWRDGLVPVWVDIRVFDAVRDAVVVQLECAGRFSANPARLYYELGGERSPFGIKSPWLPPGWLEGDKFDVGWHLHGGA